MKVAVAQINPIVGDFTYNQGKILDSIAAAKKGGADLVLFPEMALVGYPAEDLLTMPSFVEAAEKALISIVEATRGIIAVVGTIRKNPVRREKGLFNTAAILQDGKLLGFQDKILLPSYDVFSDRRHFEPGNEMPLWELGSKKVAITICEDLWQHAHEVGYAEYRRDPVEELSKLRPDLLLNLSASPYYIGREGTRLRVVTMAAKTLECPAILCNQVGGNDSLIFDGHSLFVSCKGELVFEGKGFEEDLMFVDTESAQSHPFAPQDHVEHLFNALVLGVRDYFYKQGFSRAVLGLSGGIDSAVVACIAAKALGPGNVLALSLPSRYTPDPSRHEAEELARNLGIGFKEISIESPFTSFLDVLAPHFAGRAPDVTEENLQARLRGILLMAFSNKFGYLVLSTGNKSEMAMGYATLYGDMCGGLAVLNDVSKALVYALARKINHHGEVIPLSTIEKPPSAELRPEQKDTDSLPEYPIVDKVLRAYVEEHESVEEIAEKHHLDLDLVRALVCKIHRNEYKRRQAPPGLRVTKKSFSVGRRFPIVSHWNVL